MEEFITFTEVTSEVVEKARIGRWGQIVQHDDKTSVSEKLLLKNEQREWFPKLELGQKILGTMLK